MLDLLSLFCMTKGYFRDTSLTGALLADGNAIKLEILDWLSLCHTVIHAEELPFFARTVFFLLHAYRTLS